MVCAVPTTARSWGLRRRRVADWGVGWGSTGAGDGKNASRMAGCARPGNAVPERTGRRSREHAPESVLMVGIRTGKQDEESVRGGEPVSTTRVGVSAMQPRLTNSQAFHILLGMVTLACSARAANRVPFVVQGTVQHEQFGSAPRSTEYTFTARCEDGNWSVSSRERPEGLADEVLAVGNDRGVFLTADLAREQRKALEKGRTVVNRSECVVMTNTVPNWLLAPELGPIWLTYLSARCFDTADPHRIPAPVALNVAGASSLPLFATYYLGCQRVLDSSTGLPKELVCSDDGFLRGMVHGQLVNVQRLPPPFDKGFTNIVFRVLEYETFLGSQLPKRSTLEVFWVWQSRLERIHQFTIQADLITQVPTSPIPQPTTRGIASVVDGRISTTNGPVLVSYLATNRYLEPSEVTRLPAFAEAVRRSLTMQRPALPFRTSKTPRLLVLSLLVALAAVFLYVLLHRKPQNINE
jgi:hypothetical protein